MPLNHEQRQSGVQKEGRIYSLILYDETKYTSAIFVVLRMNIFTYSRLWCGVSMQEGQKGFNEDCYISTHWGLVTTSTTTSTRTWLSCLTTPSHYLNHVDSSLKGFCGNQLRAISKVVLINLIRNMRSESTLWKLPHLPGSNRLTLIYKILHQFYTCLNKCHDVCWFFDIEFNGRISHSFF